MNGMDNFRDHFSKSPSQGQVTLPSLIPKFPIYSIFPNPTFSSFPSVVTPFQNGYLPHSQLISSPLTFPPNLSSYLYPQLAISNPSLPSSLTNPIPYPSIAPIISKTTSTSSNSLPNGYSTATTTLPIHEKVDISPPKPARTENSNHRPQKRRKKDFSIVALLAADDDGDEQETETKKVALDNSVSQTPTVASRKRKKSEIEEGEIPTPAKSAKTSPLDDNTSIPSIVHPISNEAAFRSHRIPATSESSTSTPTSDSGVFSGNVSSSGTSTPSSAPGSNHVSTITPQLIARAGLAQILRYNQLLSQQSNALAIITPDEDGDTLLHIAIASEKSQLVSEYIRRLTLQKIKLDIKNHLKQTPLHVAVITKQPLIIRGLVAAGANVNICDRNGDNCVHLACKWGDQDTIRAICESTSPEPELDVLNFSGIAPIHIAAINNNTECIKVLVESGARKNIGDGTSGKTALHHAIEGKHFNLIRLLVQFDFDVNVPTFSGVTPLQFASGLQEQEIVSYLIHNGTLSTKHMPAVQTQHRTSSEGGEQTGPTNSTDKQAHSHHT